MDRSPTRCGSKLTLGHHPQHRRRPSATRLLGQALRAATYSTPRFAPAWDELGTYRLTMGTRPACTERTSALAPPLTKAWSSSRRERAEGPGRLPGVRRFAGAPAALLGREQAPDSTNATLAQDRASALLCVSGCRSSKSRQNTARCSSAHSGIAAHAEVSARRDVAGGGRRAILAMCSRTARGGLRRGRLRALRRAAPNRTAPAR